jgi:uncharacterized protein YdeI (YjbR/CyaY-like superfamily)
MAHNDPRVDAYIERSADFAKPILGHLRELIHTACPDVEETWKWSFPCFIYHGAIMCNMATFKEHCAFGFWKASIMEDTDKILNVGEGKEGMGHLNKLYSLKDLPKDAVLKKYIKAAMKLNEQGVKIARPKPTEKDKKELKTPDYLAKELKKNKPAEKVFNDFSYSNRKEYIEWFEEAKTDATREKRLAQAIEWIAEGKSRHWKYKNC